MKKIKDLVDEIDDEICGAKKYAEMYVEYKAFGNPTYASKYKEMANDELKHATYLHDIAVALIGDINKVFTAPPEMQETWDKSHKEYVNKVAWVKQMLAM